MVDLSRLLGPLFHANAAVGLSTVDPRTWGGSSARRAYACLWLCVYVAEFAASSHRYLTTDEVTGFQMFTWVVNYAAVMWLLAQSVADYKTMMAAALSLEAIRARAVAQGIPAAPADPAYPAAAALAAANLCLAAANAARVLSSGGVGTWAALPTVYVTSFHFMALNITHAFTYLSYMFAVLQAEEGINLALAGAAGRDPSGLAGVLKFLRETRGQLVRVREDVHAHFRGFLAFRFFFVCVILPRMVHNVLVDAPTSDPVRGYVLAPAFVMVSCFCAFVLRVHAKIAATGPEAQTLLYEHLLAARSQEEKKELRRQTLACLHRRHRPDCWVFRLEFGLVITLLDTGLLVFLATNGSAEA